MQDKRRPEDLTPSICEEALGRFSQSDDSLAGVIENNHIEVRDFMLLSFVCDQNVMSIAQLSGALGLSYQTTIDCVSRLVQAELARAENPGQSWASATRIVPTGAGRILARRILDV